MDKKMEFVEKLSAQMIEWDVQIDLLKFKADSAAKELKSEYYREIDALLLKRKEAALKLQGVSAAGGVTWENLKAGTESIWDDTRTSLHDTILKIK